MQTIENITEELTKSHINNNSGSDNKEIYILPRTFHNFTYSKKQHVNYFIEKKFDSELFGEEIRNDDFNIKHYQILLVYAFIKKNIPKGSKILGIGKNFPGTLKSLTSDYEIWNMPDPSDLTKDLLTDPADITITNIKDGNIRLKNYYSYFDFVFSISAFEEIAPNAREIHKNILFNLDRLTKSGGYSLHSFDLIFGSSAPLSRLLLFFYNNSKRESKIQNKFINPSNIRSNPDLFFSDLIDDKQNKSGTAQSKNNFLIKSAAYNILLKKNASLLPELTQTKSSQFLKKTPAYIFHHMIKCGGSSAVNQLFKWFNLEFDHLVDANKINEFKKMRYNIENINSDTCLVSHFAYQGTYLSQRYPEIITRKDEIKTFIFVRDPLKFSISLYFYIRNQGRFQNISLINQLKYNNNMLSRLFPCDETNYKEVLDRYFFIGIVEYMQESFDKLAKLLNKKRVIIPVMNQSVKDTQVSDITQDFVEHFKELNKLDYLVYNYCLEKFRNM